MRGQLKRELDYLKWKRIQKRNRLRSQKGGKSVHVKDEAHAKAKDYCLSNGLVMVTWVNQLILDALNEQ